MLRWILLAAIVLWPPPAVAGPEPRAMAAVGVLSLGGKSRCSGTLVASDLVLTAGHCVLRPDRRGAVAPERVEFRTGAYPGHGSRTYEVRDIVVHPLYIGAAEDDAQWIPHDAALVRLSAGVPDHVARPIPVLARLQGAPTFLASYRGGRGQRARERRCPILGDWPEVVSLSCDVRPGESGSPIVVSVNGELGLVGVVSASSRMKRTEMAIAAKADNLIRALKAVMGGF
jgi:protease YdgD